MSDPENAGPPDSPGQSGQPEDADDEQVAADDRPSQSPVDEDSVEGNNDDNLPGQSHPRRQEPGQSQPSAPDEGDPQPGPSSAVPRSASSSSSSRQEQDDPDEGSDFVDNWTPSSSALFKDDSEDSTLGGGPDGESRNGEPSSSARLLVSTASASPSSSSSAMRLNPSGVANSNNRPSQSDFGSNGLTSSSSSSPSLSSSLPLLALNSKMVGVSSSSGASDSLRSPVPSTSSSAQIGSITLPSNSAPMPGPGPGLLGSSVPTPGLSPGPSGLSLHGEISNPPSPLGGSRPPPSTTASLASSLNTTTSSSSSSSTSTSVSSLRAQKRDHPDSPIPGPSGMRSKKACTNNSLRFSADEPLAGTSSSSSLYYSSSEAAAAASQSPPGSPLAPPLTPADNFMISSTTGLSDSVPPTPLDMHDDNDLSVPSPSPGAGTLPINHNIRRSANMGANMDDMIDSTVDSCGLPLPPQESDIDFEAEGGEFCQSSRYLDSSDEEETADDQSCKPALQRHTSANESNITTSGQVDEGQFRLVPNEPEDDYFNQKNLTSSEGISNGGKGHSETLPMSLYGDPQPGPSSRSDSFSPISHKGRTAKGPDMDSSTDEATFFDPSNISGQLDGFGHDSLDRLTNSAEPPGSSIPQLTGNSKNDARHDPEEQEVDGCQGHGGNQENVESLLPQDLHLDNLDNNELEPPSLDSSFPVIDSEPSFGQGVDLEDIQLQKFFPEHYTLAKNVNGGRPAHESASSKFSYVLSDLPLSDFKAADHSGHSREKEQSEDGTSVHQSLSVSQSNGLNVAGNEFASISSNMASTQPTPGPSSSSSSQHSSILESMTGPLSKRLRTLHSLQQRQTTATVDTSAMSSVTGSSLTPLSSTSSSTPYATSSGPSPSAGPIVTSSNCKNGKEGRNEASTSSSGSDQISSNNNNNNTKASSNEVEEQTFENSFHGGSLRDESKGGGGRDSGSGNSSGSSSSTFFGGTQQTYSVTIETSHNPIAIKPKRLLQQKSMMTSMVTAVLGEDFCRDTHPWEDPAEKNQLLPHDTPNLFSEQCSGPMRNDSLSCEVDMRQTQLLTSEPSLETRALRSLPSSHLYIREVRDASSGHGVFAKKRIPKNCRFGPVEGRPIPLDRNLTSMDHADDKLLLLVKTSNGDFVVDTLDEDMSNWMRFVRPAESVEEQNLSLIQDGDQLFFIVTKNINAKQELKVAYSSQYASQRSLKLIPQGPNKENDEGLMQDDGDNRSSDHLGIKNHLGEELLQSPKDLSLHGNYTTGDKSTESDKSPELSVSYEAKVTTKNAFTCPICPKKFTKKHSLSRHIVLHSGEKNFQCPECNMRFSHVLNLERHKKRSHTHAEFVVKADFRAQQCPTCNLRFHFDELLQVHTFAHHPDAEIQDLTVESALEQAGRRYRNEEALRFQCPACDEQFENWMHLVDHVEVHAEDGAGIVEHSRILNSDSSPKKVHKCELCYKSFLTDERLKRHMASHATDDTKPLACSHCDKRFLNNSALACHLKIHSEEKTAYDCPICGDVFNQIVNLKEHVHVHCVNGNYQCPHCSKGFPEYSLIRKHIRAFHGEKKHICFFCSKGFASADKLRIHIVVHSDVKEFLCNDCGKQFKRKDKLREHVIRMHSSPAKKARKKIAMDKEEQSQKVKENRFIPKVSPNDYHRFIYKCHECLLGFKRRGMLVNHLAKRHPNIPPQSVPELNLPILKATKDYYCQYCSKVYKSSSKRKAHILKNHPGKQLPLSSRVKGGDGEDIPESPFVIHTIDSQRHTFSATVGSVTSQPHGCPFCHKQYASNAKLLQHQRKKHMDKLPPEKQVPRKPSNGSFVGDDPRMTSNRSPMSNGHQSDHQFLSGTLGSESTADEENVEDSQFP